MRKALTWEDRSRGAAISSAGTPSPAGRAPDTSAAAVCTDTPIPRTAAAPPRP